MVALKVSTLCALTGGAVGVAGQTTYCPDPAQDFTADGGSPQWTGSGWTITGGARASSKASYDLSGGYVEWDMDLQGAHGNVNNNLYAAFPTQIGHYCDSGKTGGCAELDFIENNGHCLAATTFHTDPNGNDKGGKQTVNRIGPHVHVRAEWSGDGESLTVHVDGHAMTGAGNPGGEMKSRGAVIYSSQWTGWVPGNCGGDGNLDASSFTVSNLKIKGKVVQGSPPRQCSGPTPPGPPSPNPPSPPSPSGGGQCCYRQCGTSCQGGWCGQSEGHCTGKCHGVWCPGSYNDTVVV